MDEPSQGASSFTKRNYREKIAVVQAACQWLNVPSGRAHDYQRLMKEFWEKGLREKEHIFVHNEAYEIVDLYEAWNGRVDEFPGLKDKIAAVVGGGPILTDDERASASSIRPRNYAFVYLVAGAFLQANINVIAVDGILRSGAACHTAGDITFDWKSTRIDVQCKRLQSEKALIPRIKEARGQIEAVGEQIAGGIIAIDFSAFIRPAGKLIEATSSEGALEVCRKQLEQWKAIATRELRPSILGYIFYARVPAMIVIRESQVLAINGRPYKGYRPDSITTESLIANSNCRVPNILPAVYERLHVALSSSLQPT